MKDDGSGRKIIVHAAIAGLMSRITGAGFTSGAIAGGLNEALIKNLKGLDPGTAQIVSAIVGAAAAKAADGNAAAGASAAASGTTGVGSVATPEFTAAETADGTPYIRAELRNPTPEEKTNWFWHKHANN